MKISVIVHDQIMAASPEALRGACSQGASCGCGRCMPCVVLELAKRYHYRRFVSVPWPAEAAYWNRWDRIRYLLRQASFQEVENASGPLNTTLPAVTHGRGEMCDVHL